MKLRLCFLLVMACAASLPTWGGDQAELPPLSMVPNSPRLTGKFVWADLVTDDLSAARTFCGQLFGWTFRDVGNYAIAHNDERPLAGMFQRERPADHPAQPRWIPFLSVSSVSEAQGKVTKAGGKVLAAQQNFPQRGDQAVFADAEGAVFGAVASRRGDPADFLPEPGDWIWVQLFSRDAKAAGEFYRALGGYEVLANEAQPGSYVLASKGYARAAVITLPADKPEVKPAWLPFVRVKNVGETVALAKELGGRVLIAPKAQVVQGRVAVIADPTGAAIGILEWTGKPGQGGAKP